jgi:hypothetical protein
LEKDVSIPQSKIGIAKSDISHIHALIASLRLLTAISHHITVDGTAYNKDLIILACTVLPNWRRKQGHLLSVEDVGAVIEAKPVILVVGCGASGMMGVPEQTRQTLQASGIGVEALNTDKAVERFNELARQGANVTAALHLTC